MKLKARGRCRRSHTIPALELGAGRFTAFSKGSPAIAPVRLCSSTFTGDLYAYSIFQPFPGKRGPAKPSEPAGINSIAGQQRIRRSQGGNECPRRIPAGVTLPQPKEGHWLTTSGWNGRGEYSRPR